MFYRSDIICSFSRALASCPQRPRLLVTSLLSPQSNRSGPGEWVVLTIHVAGLLLARLFALVERKLSGKEILFTLVIERLLRKRGMMGNGEGTEETKTGQMGRVW